MYYRIWCVLYPCYWSSTICPEGHLSSLTRLSLKLLYLHHLVDILCTYCILYILFNQPTTYWMYITLDHLVATNAYAQPTNWFAVITKTAHMGLLFHHIPYHIHKWLNPILWWLNLILGSKSTLCLPCDLLTTLTRHFWTTQQHCSSCHVFVLTVYLVIAVW